MDELAKRFADIADKFGPDVVLAAKQAVVAEVYSGLTGGALALLWAAAFVWVSGWARRKGKAADCYDEDGWAFLFVITAALACILLAVGTWEFLDPWTWIALRHPELWLAKKALHI